MQADDFAAMLRERLDKRDDTQCALAEELTQRGIRTSRQAVNRWCQGSARPEPWKWAALLDALRVPASERKRWESALASRPSSPAQVA